MSNAWSIAIDTICGAFEKEPIGTFLVKPGEVAKLPPKVAALKKETLRRDKPKAIPAVSKDAVVAAFDVNKVAFLEHLEKKAHFFMLPKPIVNFVKESRMVSISENLRHAGATADAVYTKLTDKDGNVTSVAVEMQMPGATEALPKVGRTLGGPFDDREYEVLDVSYHEMTHAWLYLNEFADSDIKALYAQGVDAYEHAKDGTEREFNLPREAFLEAAAYYVEDRIRRWCEAVGGLAELLRVRPPMNALQENLANIVRDYDAPLSKDQYGRIAGVPIKSPSLSDDKLRPLRDAIDKKILDGRPLTKKRLNETPLAGLHDALWGWGP
jgi:hypothetical protein